MRLQTRSIHRSYQAIKAAFLASALLLSNAGDAHAILNPETHPLFNKGTPTKRSLYYSQHSQKTVKLRPSCSIEGKGVAHRDSKGKRKVMRDVVEGKVLGIVCKARSAHILTKKSILVLDFRRAIPRGFAIDVENIHKKGLVSWAHSKNMFFFLTRDRDLTAIPLRLSGKDTVLTVPFAVKDAKMKYHNGFLFILSGKKLLAASPKDGFRYRIFELEETEKDFSVSDGSLVLGDRKISIKGKHLKDVSLD